MGHRHLVRGQASSRVLPLCVALLAVSMLGCSSSDGASSASSLPAADSSGQAQLEPGTYADTAFGVPVEFTIAQPTVRLVHDNDENTMIWLEHDQGAGGEDTDTSREFLVVFQPDVGELTPEQLVKKGTDGCHADKLITPTPTTFLGRDAMTAEFAVPTGCADLFALKDGTSFAVGDGRVVRVIGTVIDGNGVLVYADSPEAMWPKFSPEVDAIADSLHTLG